MFWHPAGAAWHQAPAPPPRQKLQEGPPREPGQAAPAPASHGAAGVDRCAELCPSCTPRHVMWSQSFVVPPNIRGQTTIAAPAGTGAAVGSRRHHGLPSDLLV